MTDETAVTEASPFDWEEDFPAEFLTKELRFRNGTLQQLWMVYTDAETGSPEWRDVPVIDEPEEEV